ncbi:unnamed protein product [Schistosoma margrebowiei]|uniref:Uncharacterized protein n=1 Tax=Schistosoma margrebowiei TaxID=48269 RepID=A0A183MHE1_9TREM|nr:unnamed protein product [Schistosoma margrebowiei]
MEHGTLESFAAFPFESYMSKIRRSVHCGFAAAKQAAQRYAEEVYFQSILNQDMADNVIEPEVSDDSSKQMVSNRNSKLSTARPDNVVIDKGRPGFVTEIRDGGLIRFRPFHNPSDLYTDPFPSSNIGILKAVTELCSKMDRLIAVCERLAIGVIERPMEDKDSDAITFPLRTHDELRSLEAALENQKFRDHFSDNKTNETKKQISEGLICEQIADKITRFERLIMLAVLALLLALDSRDLVVRGFRRPSQLCLVRKAQEETMDPGFVLLGTRQQGIPVIFKELVLPGGFDLVSPRDVTTDLSEPRPTSCRTEM